MKRIVVGFTMVVWYFTATTTMAFLTVPRHGQRWLIRGGGFLKTSRRDSSSSRRLVEVLVVPGRLLMSSNTDLQRTLAPGSHMSELEVKKSRFIGYAQNAENWKDAQNYIAEIKALHPKGRHWCFGFRSGVNPVQERCSDDGEPTGTGTFLTKRRIRLWVERLKIHFVTYPWR
jgi:hypothetical protein